MCHLSAITELADRVVPGVWRVGLFGSAARCPGDGTCTSGASDVDMIVVHPVGDEHPALAVRRTLVAKMDDLRLVADVTLLSAREVDSTRFWADENAIDLSAAIMACDRSGLGTNKNHIV
jgi:predicted nucleotidyltransferase